MITLCAVQHLHITHSVIFGIAALYLKILKFIKYCSHINLCMCCTGLIHMILS